MSAKNVFTLINTVTLAERRSAEVAWLRHTTFRQRREVMSYVKNGLVHPDRDLAARAYRWAKGETEFNIFRNTRAGLGAVLASFWIPGVSQSVFKLRVARRIVEVSERYLAASHIPTVGDSPD
jgi:cob(I)alamin adenosyltransferase